MDAPKLETWPLLTATGALLAFLIGVYTLVGRERKSPYLINFVFATFALASVGAICDLAALVAGQFRDTLLRIGLGLLVAALVLATWRLIRLFFRFSYFVDSIHLKHTWPWRKSKELYRHLRRHKSYEHNPEPLDSAVLEGVRSILQTNNGTFSERTNLGHSSLALALEHQGQANEILAELARLFLERNHTVQYMTASRHPIEFVQYLHTSWAKVSTTKWEQVCSRIVVVDAYTRHFGYTDSIYSVQTRALTKTFGVRVVGASVSFAGMHTASSTAFNVVKSTTVGNVRLPTLVIYEDSFAIADLESAEQYHVFIRHVLPSERMWGGMFTVMAETAQPDADWKLLSSYCSFAVDCRTIHAQASAATTGK